MSALAMHLAEAYLYVARVNHYLVKVKLDNITNEDFAEAEQILIDWENEKGHMYTEYALALDLIQQEIKSRRNS